MADTVDTLVLMNQAPNYVARFTNISDGSGESAVVKVDKSTLTGLLGREPGKLCIKEVQWSIQGFTSVRIYWDHTTDDEACVLGAGAGYFNYTLGGNSGLVDPGSTGGTGDVIFTTAGAISGATYDITLVLLMKD